jgi:hypothetical protein
MKLAEAIRYALSRWDGLCRFAGPDLFLTSAKVLPLPISAKNTSRFVRFFLLAKSSDAKPNRASMSCPSSHKSQFAMFQAVIRDSLA